MKLKIRDTQENECEVWLRYDEDEVDLMCKDKDGDNRTIATLQSDKTIKIQSGSGFELKEYS